MKGRRNGAKGNATLPRGEAPGGSDVDSPPAHSGGNANPGASRRAQPVQRSPRQPRENSLGAANTWRREARRQMTRPTARGRAAPARREDLRAPTLRGLRAERTRPHGGLAGTRDGAGKGEASRWTRDAPTAASGARPSNGCLACKPPFYLLLRRDGARQTASCTRACPRGFYKVTKKRNGFCAKCTMRGCAECDRHHYCSRCAADFVNFFGKCIPSHPENALETPYPRKTIYSPPAILETSGTPPSARGTRPSHRTAGSSRTTSAPSAGPPRAPSAGPRRPPSSRTSSSAPPSSGPPSSPPALVNHSRPSPAVRVRPRRPQEKRPCRKKAAKKGKADKDGERRRNWKGRKKERQNKSKKGQKAKRKGCRKRMKGRRNGAKGNATLPRGEGSPAPTSTPPPPLRRERQPRGLPQSPARPAKPPSAAENSLGAANTWRREARRQMTRPTARGRAASRPPPKASARRR
nr:R-spondin-3-like [Penaeus vannamei]